MLLLGCARATSKVCIPYGRWRSIPTQSSSSTAVRHCLPNWSRALHLQGVRYQKQDEKNEEDIKQTSGEKRKDETEEKQKYEEYKFPHEDWDIKRERRYAKSIFLRAYGSFFFGMAVIGLYILYKRAERDEKRKGTAKPELETYEDPHCKGSAGKLALRRGCWLPVALFPNDKLLDDIWNFKLRRDDILVVSFPKSGTTWVQEIVYMIQSDLDTEGEKNRNLDERFPYIEYVYPGLKELEKRTGPRMLKSHLPYHHLPKCIFDGVGKVIYISRNPKDVVVSFYHFMRMMSEVSYKGTINDFAMAFIRGQVPYGPWGMHIMEFMDMQKIKGNILCIKYEDLQENPHKTVAKIASFLGKPLSEKQIDQIVEHCSFEKMKSNPSTNYSWWDDIGLRNKGEAPFMRKGVVGDWKNHLKDEAIIMALDSLSISYFNKMGVHFRDS